jgi:hypothetical protein
MLCSFGWFRPPETDSSSQLKPHAPLDTALSTVAFFLVSKRATASESCIVFRAWTCFSRLCCAGLSQPRFSPWHHLPTHSCTPIHPPADMRPTPLPPVFFLSAEFAATITSRCTPNPLYPAAPSSHAQIPHGVCRRINQVTAKFTDGHGPGCRSWHVGAVTLGCPQLDGENCGGREQRGWRQRVQCVRVTGSKPGHKCVWGAKALKRCRYVISTSAACKGSHYASPGVAAPATGALPAACCRLRPLALLGEGEGLQNMLAQPCADVAPPLAEAGVMQETKDPSDPRSSASVKAADAAPPVPALLLPLPPPSSVKPPRRGGPPTSGESGMAMDSCCRRTRSLSSRQLSMAVAWAVWARSSAAGRRGKRQAGVWQAASEANPEQPCSKATHAAQHSTALKWLQKGGAWAFVGTRPAWLCCVAPDTRATSCMLSFSSCAVRCFSARSSPFAIRSSSCCRASSCSAALLSSPRVAPSAAGGGAHAQAPLLSREGGGVLAEWLPCPSSSGGWARRGSSTHPAAPAAAARSPGTGSRLGAAPCPAPPSAPPAHPAGPACAPPGSTTPPAPRSKSAAPAPSQAGSAAPPV